jgi:hypothetical protein
MFSNKFNLKQASLYYQILLSIVSLCRKLFNTLKNLLLMLDLAARSTWVCSDIISA